MSFKATALAVLLTTQLALAGCNSIVATEVIPSGVKSDYYISLAGGAMYLGQEAKKLELYTTAEGEEGRYIQSLGLYDIKVVDNKVSEIRTASSEIKLSSELYVGQSKASLESYLTNTVKHTAKDRVLYYDTLHSVVTEVGYNKEDKATVIRFKSMVLEEG